ncbi:conserved Plasmodium protein, unknown function [Plasmodium berghei]|uniref:Uncharacterized protein n=1 Tax=Plasmodium berghei TaxID=5821 RepID=A0A0Y9TMC4_PLABE|nr:conserved Plasmodium protein, unknown function [Plasmodium berghei]SCM17013.1 conserved Plasmodium protein, unknown function [Plasmodium berghei]
MNPESSSLDPIEKNDESFKDDMYTQKNTNFEFQGFTKNIENQGKLCEGFETTMNDIEIEETKLCKTVLNNKKSNNLEIDDMDVNNIHANNRQENVIKIEGVEKKCGDMHNTELIHIKKDISRLNNFKKEDENIINLYDENSSHKIDNETLYHGKGKSLQQIKLSNNLNASLAHSSIENKQNSPKIICENNMNIEMRDKNYKNYKNIDQGSVTNEAQCESSYVDDKNCDNTGDKNENRNNHSFTKECSNNNNRIKNGVQKEYRKNVIMNKQNTNINYKMTNWEKENEKFKELYKNDKNTNIIIYKRIYQSYIFLKKEYNELINENRKKLRINKKLKYELDNLKNDNNYYSNYFLNNDSENILEDLASGISSIFKWMDIENKIGQKNYENAINVFKNSNNNIGNNLQNDDDHENMIKTDLEVEQNENSEKKKKDISNKCNLNDKPSKKFHDVEYNKMDEIEKCENQVILNNEIVKKETKVNTIKTDPIELKDKKEFSMDIEEIKKNGILKLDLIKSTIINNFIPSYIYNDLNNESFTNSISKKNETGVGTETGVESAQNDKINNVNVNLIDNINYSNKEKKGDNDYDNNSVNLINGEHLNILSPEYIVGNLSNIIKNFRNNKNIKDTNNIDEIYEKELHLNVINDKKNEIDNYNKNSKIDKCENNRNIEYCSSNEKDGASNSFIIKGENKNSYSFSNIVNDNKIRKNSFLWEKENILKKKNIKYAKHIPIKIEKDGQHFLKNTNKIDNFVVTNNINIIDYLKVKLYMKNKNEKIAKIGTKCIENIHRDKKNIEYATNKYANKICIKNCNKKKQNPNNTINGKLNYCKDGTHFDRKNIIHNKNVNKINIEKESIFHISNYKENKYMPINLSPFFLVDDKKKNSLDSELNINHLKKNMRFILKKKNNKKQNNSQIANLSNIQLDNHVNNPDFEKNEISKTIVKKLNVSEKEIKNKNKLCDFKNNKENVDKWKHFFKRYITGNQKRRFTLHILNKRILKNKCRNRKICIYKIEENINHINFDQIFNYVNYFVKFTNNYPKHIYQFVKKRKTIITNQDCDINIKKRVTYLCLFKRCVKYEFWYFDKFNHVYFMKGMKKKKKYSQVRNNEKIEEAEKIEIDVNNKKYLFDINKDVEKSKENENPNIEKNYDNEKNGILNKLNESPVLDIDDDMLEKYIFKETEDAAPNVLIEFKEALKKHILSLNILNRQIKKIECKSDNEEIIIIGIKIYLYDTYTLLFVYALNSIEYSVKKWIKNNIDKLKLYIKKYNSKVLNFFKAYSINMFTFFCNFLNIIENYIHQFPFYFSISFDDLIMKNLI